MSALIGALRVSLSADTANFETGMKRAQRQTQTSATAIGASVNHIKTALTGLAAGLTIGLFTHLVKEGLEYAGSLREVAQQLGVTTTELQTLRFAATQTGVSQDLLEVGLRRLTVSMGKATLGSEAQKKAFSAIGISLDEIKGKSTGEVFSKIADGLKNVTDRSQRAAIEMTLMGRSGSMLDTMLSGGSAALNELADAAKTLGIVLSDEQIQRAEETSHKLEALKTVLSASIAGAVADNADAIVGLGNALGFLIQKIGQSLQGWRVLKTEIAAFWNADPFHGQNPLTAPDQAVRVMQFHDRLNASLAGKTPATPAGQDIGKFLGGSGREKKPKEDHSAQDALNAAHQFDQDIRRAQLDVLHATQDLAADYIERTSIGIEILNSEKAANDAEMKYQVALFKLTKGKEGQSEAQVAQLQAQYDIKDGLERQKLLQDEQDQRIADTNELIQHDYDRRKDVLQSQEQLATTMSERRKIELELLEIAYEQKKQALQDIIDTSKDNKAREDARRDLVNLNATHANDKQGVINSTRGPMEEWAASVPQKAAEITEAFQSIDANGLESISQGLAGVIAGTESMGQAMHNVAQQMIAEISMVIIKMLILKAIQAATGALGGNGFNFSAAADTANALPMSVDMGSAMPASLPGFATGGSMVIGGMGGVDRNVLSINGIPKAKVSQGEELRIVPDGQGMGGTVVINTFEMHSPVVTSDLLDEMNAKSAAAAEAGARLGVSRMVDMNQRSFGRTQRV